MCVQVCAGAAGRGVLRVASGGPGVGGTGGQLLCGGALLVLRVPDVLWGYVLLNSLQTELFLAVLHPFQIALVSSLQQARCTLVACDSK